MKAIKAIVLAVVLSAIWISSVVEKSAAQETAAAENVAQEKAAMLPQAFGGWEKQSDARRGTDPSTVDPAQGRVLKEYGFSDFETATYARPDRKLIVKAARFQDASGAYGAFTFYRSPKMLTERIGTMAASANENILFFSDNVLVQAQFDRVTAMSASELRELAEALPRVQGTAANLPALPSYFPREQVVPNSAKYILGPVALNALGSPVDPGVVDFSRNAEVMTGKYATSGGTADFMLIAYPTPQIAMERLKALEAANAQTTNGTTFVAKRAGPIVAMVKGQVSQWDARSLLGYVNYEADVTWNENTGLSKRDNIGNLVVAASILAGIIFLFSIVSGTLFAFGRMLKRRFFPSRYQTESDDGEFIRLDIEK
ncbi:MAG TPA: DUF6599 family protein [Clostridia bacterium]|nr:DUF6599 family protein [Clostridia bacterium]